MGRLGAPCKAGRALVLARHCESLDDGPEKELSLTASKAEGVAWAGCAATGCAAEEASSVCSRCRAERHCP